MNIKNIIASVISAIVVAVVAFSFFGSTTTVIKEQPVVKGSSDFSNTPVITVNGVSTWYVKVPFATGTSTLCSIPNPLVSYAGASTTSNIATTSLLYVSAKWTSGTSTAMVYDLATSTSRNATTSSMVSGFAVAAGATSTSIGWIPSTWNMAKIPANTYVNLIVNDLKTFPTSMGYCQAEFRQI